MSLAFEGQVVVVTGATSSLGSALVDRFAGQGASVIATDVDTGAWEGSTPSAAELAAAPTFLPLDVTDPDQSFAVVDQVVAAHGRLDVWINNSAVLRSGAASTLSRGDWDESLAVIVTGSFNCAQAAGRRMIAQASGVIVNVSSVDAFHVVEGRVAWSVAQAGLVMLTQALAVEWASLGVRVVGVAPGVLAAGPASLRAPDRRIPLGRPGGSDEVAEAVLYLASREASYVLGETLRVDGGWSAYQLF